ncbi:MAG: hypothetical protein ACSHX5_02695 [Phycisphaerales bacterium]
MMDQDRSTEMIREYLGDSAAAGGPFAILGVGHGPLETSMILRACQARLAQINGHRRSQSQDADDVRMAVHAAASQLLDPELCAELAQHWPEGTDEVGVVGVSPTAWRVDAGRPVDTRLSQQAIRLVGACGGWNARSRKRLGQFARLNAIPASQLVGGIIQGTGQAVVSASGVSESHVQEFGAVRGPSLMDPREQALPWGLIPAAFAMMALSLIAAGFVSSVDQARERKENSVAAVQDGGSELSERIQSTQGSGVTGDSDRSHYSAILFELEKFEREGIQDVDGAVRFSELGDRLTQQWTEFSASELDRAAGSVRRVLGNVLSAEMFDACSSFLKIQGSASDSMLLLGFRMWLFGGVDQGPVYSVMIGRADDIDFPGAFDRALVGSFLIHKTEAKDDPDWWDWWIGQLEPMTERIGGQRGSILLSAAYQLMIDPEMGQEWDRCVQQIVQNLQWGAGSVARSWVLGVVVDPAVKSDRLAILMRGIVLYSSAQGLGMDMMLEGDETISAREAYLAKLRNRWSGDGSGGSDVRSRLIARLEELVQMTRMPALEEQSMIRCVELARANSAAWVRSGGDEAGAMILMDSFEDPLGSPQLGTSTIGRALDLTSSAQDEEWATKARNLESQEELDVLLHSLDRVGTIGPKSGHALVYLAMSAPNLSVRDHAERVILSRPDEAAILIALDRVVGSDRVSRRVVELVNSYIGFDGSSIDSASSREAILGKLANIGMLEDGEGAQSVQDFEYSMNDAYTHRSGSAEMIGAEAAYREVAQRMLRDGIEIPRLIRTKLLIRLSRSDGPMQRFAAYQAALLELHAERVLRKQRGLESRVQRVFDAVELREQAASDVYELMLIYERAMAELWLIEMEMEIVS